MLNVYLSRSVYVHSNLSYPNLLDAGIYWQNIQYGSRVGVEIYNYRKYIVLALTFVNTRKFKTFNEVSVD